MLQYLLDAFDIHMSEKAIKPSVILQSTFITHDDFKKIVKLAIVLQEEDEKKRLFY